MRKYIDIDAIIKLIDNLFEKATNAQGEYRNGAQHTLITMKDCLNNLETKDPYDQRVQYPSIKDGIMAHAETYSFNIESELFQQLSKDHQELWRKEIKRACISGGEAAVELTRDPRYQENTVIQEVSKENNIKCPFEPLLNVSADCLKKCVKCLIKENGGLYNGPCGYID